MPRRTSRPRARAPRAPGSSSAHLEQPLSGSKLSDHLVPTEVTLRFDDHEELQLFKTWLDRKEKKAYYNEAALWLFDPTSNNWGTATVWGKMPVNISAVDVLIDLDLDSLQQISIATGVDIPTRRWQRVAELNGFPDLTWRAPPTIAVVPPTPPLRPAPVAPDAPRLKRLQEAKASPQKPCFLLYATQPVERDDDGDSQTSETRST